MPEKYLILGANSFYGRNFAIAVEKKGDVALRLQRPEWNLGDPLPDESFDYVVNFVSRSLVAESWADPMGWMTTNAVLFTALLEQLKEREFKKFIHVSTPEVYGSTDGWVDETYTAWQPSTPYAVSRAAGDMILAAYRRAYNVPAVITRTANIYGPGQGENRIVPLVFDHLRRKEKLLLDGGGSTVRSFIHVRDACAALYLVARQGSIGQTYHISTMCETSIIGLVKRIGRVLGVRPQEFLGTRPDRLGKDEFYLLKSERIRNMGWRDTITLDRGLEEYARAGTGFTG